MQDSVNAAASSYPPTWYSATMVPAAVRAPLSYDLDVDVCVIGGGLAGLTAARELARRGRSSKRAALPGAHRARTTDSCCPALPSRCRT